MRLLFDDLVGSRKQRRWHGQAKSLRCLQVYDEFVFAWSLHRQIGRFLAFQYAINVCSGPSILIIKIRPIRNQPASSNKCPLNVYRRELMAGRGCDDQLDVGCTDPARRHDQSAIWRLGEVFDCAFNLIRFTKIDRAYFNADRWRYGLYDCELANSVSKTGIAKNGGLLHARRETP